MPRAALHWTLMGVLALGVSAGGQAPRPAAPARDTPAQRQNAPAEITGRISGRVIASDTGRPVGGARVSITAPELSRSAAALTDEDGGFEFTGLPAGRYTVSVSRPGFISLSWGQRRPLQPGTPLQLREGQTLTGIDFRLLRGGVVTGRVHDRNGEPMPGAMVRVMRSQYVQGQRQLVPAGSGQTDDRGMYRVWGLNPGDYYVTAVAPMADRGERGGPPTGIVAIARGTSGAVEVVGQSPEADAVTYAPTFYPGVVSAAEAQPVTVGLSAEVAGVDFGVLRVRTSVVSGRVIGVDGQPPGAGAVSLVAEGMPVRGGGPFGGAYSGRVQNDGGFSIAGVPPGRYVLRAYSGGGRGRGGSVIEGSAIQSLAVDGDVSVQVVLAPGSTISGSVTSASAALPDPGQFRVSVLPVHGGGPGGTPSARVGRDGTFTVDGITAGPHFVRAQPPRGWALETVLAGGRDISDTPVTLRSGERLEAVTLVFTDRLSEVSGHVTDRFGAPVSEFTVLAFPLDSTHWHAHSRHIMTARPDQTGRYQLRGLPPGEYFLAVVDPVEPGEWFNPAFLEGQQASAVRVSVRVGDVHVQDFRVSRLF